MRTGLSGHSWLYALLKASSPATATAAALRARGETGFMAVPSE
jgi:hypothetical protein